MAMCLYSIGLGDNVGGMMVACLLLDVINSVIMSPRLCVELWAVAWLEVCCSAGSNAI